MRSRRRRKSKSVRIKHKICRDPRSLTELDPENETVG
jgi:hypothetical protein